MSADFQVSGGNRNAPFTLKIHRGEGMALLAMNWRGGTRPPDDFVGFAIEYREPDGDRFFPLNNRLGFEGAGGVVNPESKPTTLSPIQMFRWVHFPRNADLAGDFHYRVTPVFMNQDDDLSYGQPQEAALELRRETYPGELNVAFTRGFVSSQAFVDRFKTVSKLLPAKADEGLEFKPTHDRAKDALPWMGFEARSALLELLDEAIADRDAQVRVVAYDLNEPELVSRLKKLKKRLRVIVDDEGAHGKATSAETEAAKQLAASAGAENVKRQHMGNLQHNKTIVVDGPRTQAVVGGSTNFSWRGFYVQANNALIMRGPKAVKLFSEAFDAYWAHDDVAGFSATPPAALRSVGLDSVSVRVGFSPYASANSQLQGIADEIAKTKSSLLFSLAFLYQTRGPIRREITALRENKDVFVYGISDKKVGGLDVQVPGGSPAAVSPAALGKDAPEPFKSEPKGGGGNRMHHKFVVIDFDKPSARVYLGSYNFSDAADESNGENLLLIRDRRVAVAYAVEALRIFDHYHFRVTQQDKKAKREKLVLSKPPRKPGEKPWWLEDYTVAHKIRDRELFA
ncbi:MAG TPA: phospholipase D-like domain-containing protein [Thermoleophilaceae bacterium]|nr:phospholipase D-like domain-containing protein [Thermoleophilaceae bacterium]